MQAPCHGPQKARRILARRARIRTRKAASYQEARPRTNQVPRSAYARESSAANGEPWEQCDPGDIGLREDPQANNCAGWCLVSRTEVVDFPAGPAAASDWR